MSEERHDTVEAHDVVLVGGGIMSATLGVLLRRLQPDWSIAVYERLDEVALEASAAWHNAGTGHAGLCELNYTGTKAFTIAEQFQLSRQLWAHLVQDGTLGAANGFLNPVPHMAFVTGASDIEFLRQRHEGLAGHPLFAGIRYTEDPPTIAEWAPLLTDSRPPGEFLAATRDDTGCDVDFGAVTRQLFAHLASRGVAVHTGHEVRRLRRTGDDWRLGIRNRHTGARSRIGARFVFVGAGGWTLKLLQRAGLPEVRGYGVLPVSGRFLRCDDPAVVERHHAKVYGRAPLGAPPMSMPHLDTRVVDGKRAILFGPYPGTSPRFLLNGSLLDAPASLRPHNLLPMVSMATHNLPLMKLFAAQVAATGAKNLAALRRFAPGARESDWAMITAGQRAQIVKRDPGLGGKLEFGTEVVAARDGSIAAVLGASPGASTATAIMLEVLQRCFPEHRDRWAAPLREMIPTLGMSLADNPDRAVWTMKRTAEILGLPG